MATRTHRLHLSTILATALLALTIGGCSSTCKKPTPEPSQQPTEQPSQQGALGESDIARGDAEAGILPIGAPCGGDLGACDATSFCRYPTEAPCGDGGVVGVCEARPTGCHRDCPGVCGCNGTRFCNSCVAEARGYSIRHKGTCQESPDVTP